MVDIKPIEGKEKILFFRRYADRDQKDGAKLALQTEHTWSYETDVESTPTKDGVVNASGSTEVTLAIEAILTNDELSDVLKNAVLSGDLMEVWEVNLSDKQSDGSFGAIYAQGKLTKWEDPATVGEFTTLSTEMKIDGIPQKGTVKITEEQAEKINYVFTNLNKETPKTTGK